MDAVPDGRGGNRARPTNEVEGDLSETRESRFGKPHAASIAIPQNKAHYGPLAGRTSRGNLAWPVTGKSPARSRRGNTNPISFSATNQAQFQKSVAELVRVWRWDQQAKAAKILRFQRRH